MKSFNSVKKKSESYARFMREYFPESFENEKLNDLLCDIIFDDEKSLFVSETNEKQKEDFKSYIYSIFDENREEKKIDPIQTLHDLGYEVHECTTVDQCKRLKKYYEKSELICTLRSDESIEQRLKKHKIFFFIKKDILNIKREEKPIRDGMYGTSVMCLQYTKNGFLSIKNRYNHTVANCDNTIGNNLDNLAPGLDASFRKHFLIKKSEQSNSIELCGREFRENKIFKKNIELNGVIFGRQKYYKNGEFVFINKDHQYLAEYFIFDTKENKVLNVSGVSDYLFKIKFDRIIITKDKKYKEQDGELVVLVS